MDVSVINQQPCVKLNFKGGKSLKREMTVLMNESKSALEEISGDSFNSKTLRTLFLPDFKPRTPNSMMAISANGRPVEVGYRVDEKNGVVTIDIFTKEPKETLLGNKQYIIDTNDEGNLVMKSGYMSSDEEACNQAGIKGIGTIEKILQISDAIKKGIKSIPCTSYAKAVLFHFKMGFLPVPDLKPVYSIPGVSQMMRKLTYDFTSDIAPSNYTPVIVSKGIFKKEYYLDVNTTQFIATIRQIKQNHQDGMRPYIGGRNVDMVLDGKNYNTWKQMIENSFGNLI